MPQANLSYSAHLTLDAPAILARTEEVIKAADAGAGTCKGRAYPLAQTHHDHVFLHIRVLDKPHRDATFMKALLAELHGALDPMIGTPCAFSIELGFQSPYGSSSDITA